MSDRATPSRASPDRAAAAERWRALRGLEAWLRTPMLALGAAWLILVLIELNGGGTSLTEALSIAIWAVFLGEFVLRLVLAPARGRFLWRNWLTVLALLAPALRLLAAFRFLRFLRFARVARGFRLVRVVGGLNRGMNALRRTLRRRGLGYVLAVTVLVELLGAAGMAAFEPAHEVPGGFESYGDALWWTAMLLTTMGSQFWPVTTEGRVLCLLLAVYAFTVFGYITASFASAFLGRDVAGADRDGPVGGSDPREHRRRRQTEA